MDGCNIDGPEPGTIAINELDKNSDMCCLEENFTVLQMTLINSNVYPYNTSYKPLYNVPIVSGVTTVMDNITRNPFIMVVNEALYYGKIGPFTN